MALTIKELWEIYVPTTNNGQEIPHHHHRQWDAKVRRRAGGLSILKTVKGQWLNTIDNTTVEERMIPVRIMATRTEITAIAEMTAQHYEQQAIFLYRVSDCALIVQKEQK